MRATWPGNTYILILKLLHKDLLINFRICQTFNKQNTFIEIY